MVRKQFEFPMRTTKAYQSQSDGLKHIIAVASDNRLDLYLEYFDISALSDMVKSAKMTKPNKPTEGLVDLMETHRETFAFGYSTDAWITHSLTPDEDGDFHDVYELYIDFALKEGAWEGDELYEEIKNGQIVKQLSVGGYIENEEDMEWEDVEFEDEDGNEVSIQVLKIIHFRLEHVAVTPEGWAVNPRTRFEDTVKSKDPGFMACIYKSLADDTFQKEYTSKQKSSTQEPKENTEEDPNTDTEEAPEFEKGVSIANIPGIIMKTLREIFEERNKMPNIEKARKFVDELKELGLTEEELKELNLSFTPVESDEDSSGEEEEDSPDMTEEIEKSLAPVKESLKSLTDKVDSVDLEGKMTEFKEEIVKSLSEKYDAALEERDEVIKSLKDSIEELSGETTPPANEPEDKKNKSQDTSGDEDEKEEDEPERTKDNLWE